MRHRLLLMVLVSVSLAVGLFYLAFFTGNDWRPPVCEGCNVVLITVDTLRADHLGCYGYQRNTTPFLDALAEDGILFDNVVTPRPKTTPSLVSMLTGQYPFNHGIRALYQPLYDAVTLPAILHNEGFTTAAFVSNWVLNPTLSGLDRFFETYNYNYTRPELNRKDIWERNAEETNSDVFAWLRKRETDQFFLWIHYIDPHGPYLPPEHFRHRFSHDGRRMVPRDKVAPYQVLPSAYVEGEETDGNDYIDRYDNEIYYTDKQIGMLLEELEALGLVDETIVFFSADHGESLGQHDYYFEHGREVYEDSSRIPLIVRLPNRFDVRGRGVKSLISIMDLFPTILALLGIENDRVGNLDGVDFSHLIFGEEGEAVDRVFIERYQKGNYSRAALRTKDKKVVKIENRFECYDLLSDPNEVDPNGCAVAGFPELVTELEETIDETLRTGKDAHAVNPSKEDIERLKALGYIK